MKPATARKICKLCGNLPLAVFCAGSMLSKGRDPETYARDLEKESKHTLGSGSGKGFFDQFDKFTDKHRQDIPAVFRLSYNLLEDYQQHMFRCTGVFPAPFGQAAACATAGIAAGR